MEGESGSERNGLKYTCCRRPACGERAFDQQAPAFPLPGGDRGAAAAFPPRRRGNGMGGSRCSLGQGLACGPRSRQAVRRATAEDASLWRHSLVEARGREPPPAKPGACLAAGGPGKPPGRPQQAGGWGCFRKEAWETRCVAGCQRCRALAVTRESKRQVLSAQGWGACFGIP